MSAMAEPLSAGDELLRWTSELGSGSWERFRDAAAYVSQKHRDPRRPWMLASDLSMLGHLDIDWASRSWSIAPPTLNLVPGLWLCVVLTGSRPYHVERRFEEATDDLEVYPFEIEQAPAPAAMFAQCASVEAGEMIARRLDARFVVHPARALVSVLPHIDDHQRTPAPEPALEEAKRFDSEGLRWRADHGRHPGLYRIDLHGRPVHRWLDPNGSWWSVGLPTGQFIALRESKRQAMRWRPPASDGSQPASFEVRPSLSLPVLAERAATVSSGLVPKLHDGWRRYLNVPQDVAQAIAAALDQRIA